MVGHKSRKIDYAAVAVLGTFGLFASGYALSSSEAAAASGYTITVKNNCAYDLKIHGFSEQEILPAQALAPTQSHVFDLDMSMGRWSAGRLYGCWEEVPESGLKDGLAMQMSCALAEMTVANAVGNVNANITYVDAIALPLKLSVDDATACNPGTCAVESVFTEEQVARQCPTRLNGKACVSANILCTNPVYGDPGRSDCSALDEAIRQCIDANTDCAGAAGSNTVSVYGCAGSFFSDPGGAVPAGKKYCAALNRGVLASAENQTNSDAFYKTMPYNRYAAFVHEIAGGIYAFAYDDYPSQAGHSGDLGALTSSNLTVEFCS